MIISMINVEIILFVIVFVFEFEVLCLFFIDFERYMYDFY